MALAMERPKDVFPTPGGPTKHKIVAFDCGFNFRTLKNSKILSLIFVNP